MKTLMEDLMNLDLEGQKQAIREISEDTSHYAVVGVDFYKYSSMPPETFIAFPAIIERLLNVAALTCVEMAPFLFPEQNGGSLQAFSRRIDTGDGFFLIFDDPLQAFTFVVNFSVVLRLYNTGSFSNDKQNPFELSARYCITSGPVYQYRKNYFGRAIILCARIMARDRLNRFCIDGEVHRWFMRAILGIENVKNINQNFVKNIDLASRYSFDSAKKNFRFFNSIERCVELKIPAAREKEAELDIYVVFVEATLSQGTDKKSDIAISVGNINTEGLATF